MMARYRCEWQNGISRGMIWKKTQTINFDTSHLNQSVTELK